MAMKRKILMTCLLTATSCIGISAQELLNLQTGKTQVALSPTIPHRQVQSDDKGIVVVYNFSNAVIMPDDVYAGTKRVAIEGFGLNEVIGEPSYLIRTDNFAVPVGKKATLQLLDCEYKDFSYEMAPARQPLVDSSKDVYSKSNVRPITPYSGFLPKQSIAEDYVQTYRGHGMLGVKVMPVSYDYTNRKVRIYTKLSYRITFTDDNSEALPQVIQEGQLTDDFLNNMTINGSSLKKLLKAPSALSQLKASQSMLIISTPKYESEVRKYAEWKRTLGIKTTVAIRSDWTPTLIKSTTKQEYASKGISYLLIVGDYEDVPGQNSSLIRSHVTDLYYGCMDGDSDKLPDIYRGRISVSNLSEAQTILGKIRQYESAPTTDANFYKKGLNCAYFQDYNDGDTYADRRFAQTSEDVRNYLVSKGKNVERVYYTESQYTPKYWNKTNFSFGEPIPSELQKPNFAWNGNATDITNAINKGAFYVLHRDHGDETFWGDPRYTISNINQLSNGNKLPIVFSMNCLTGKYNGRTCFTEAFLRKSNGGCVAIYGATEVSYSGYNDALTLGMFDAIWPSPGLRVNFPNVSGTGGTTPTPTYTLGQILDQGFVRMGETYGSKSQNYAQYTRELFHCFGDPSMRIYTAVPTSFSNVKVSRNANNVTVSYSGDDGTIHFYDTTTGDIKSYSGTSASYTTQSPNSVVVSITGVNKIPYTNTPSAPATVYIQNETISTNRTVNADVVKIGSAVTTTKANGPVNVNSGKLSVTSKSVTIEPVLKVAKNAELIINLKK